jgi:hypothetical protein
MVSWHLLTHPSYPRWLAFLVIQPFNFVAEGFVLLAGVAVGLQMGKGGASAARLLRRAASLLLVNYALALFITLLGVAARRLGVPMLAPLPPSLIAVVTLQYQPYLADVLTLFVFLFASAPVFQYLHARFGELGLVAVSVALFCTAQVFPLNAQGAFIYNSWQVFFVAGMIVGVRYHRRGNQLGQPTATQIAVVLVAFCGVAAVRFLLSGPDLTTVTGWQTFVVFSRKPLTIARIVYIGLEMLLIAQMTLRWWDQLRDWPAVRSVTLLGRFSLHVFVASVVLDYLLKFAISWSGITFPANMVLWLGELGAIYVFALLLRPAAPRLRTA